MKKSREFYRGIFSMIHIAYGFMPFPVEYTNSEKGKDMVLNLWDSRLGMYADEVILKAIENCIANEDRSPNLVKVLQYVKTVEQEERFAKQAKQFESGRFDCD